MSFNLVYSYGVKATFNYKNVDYSTFVVYRCFCIRTV